MAKNKSSKSHPVRNTLGLGIVAAGVLGAYLLYGKEGSKRREKIKGWTLKARGEVLEKIESLKEVNEKTYNDVVDKVMKKYETLKNIDKSEVAVLVSDIKKHWKNIKQSLETSASTSKKVKAPKNKAKK